MKNFATPLAASALLTLIGAASTVAAQTAPPAPAKPAPALVAKPAVKPAPPAAAGKPAGAAKAIEAQPAPPSDPAAAPEAAGPEAVAPAADPAAQPAAAESGAPVAQPPVAESEAAKAEAQGPEPQRPPPPEMSGPARPIPPPRLRGPRPEPEGDAVPGPGYSEHRFYGALGVRNLFSADDGLEPFSEDGLLAQLELRGAYRVFRSGPFAAGLVASYGFGRTESTIRGVKSELGLSRLALGLEASYQLWRLEFFGRLVPSALHVGAEVADGSSADPLGASDWTWGLDATAGARFRIASAGRSHEPAASFWLGVNIGYGFAGEVELGLQPELEDDDKRQFGGVALPPLSPSGVVNQLAFGVSF